MARTFNAVSRASSSSDSDSDDAYAKKTTTTTPTKKRNYKKQVGGHRPLPPTAGGGGVLLDGVGRLSISATTNPRWSRQLGSSTVGYDSDGGGRKQRSPQLFQQWMRGDADSRTVLSKLGYGGGRESDRDGVQRQPSTLSAGKYNGDAPLVDLHIHIDHNNIGSLAFGMDGKNT